MNIQFNEDQFNNWYNSTTSVEDFAKQLSTQHDTKISVGLVKQACTALNLDLRKRKRGNRITFTFVKQDVKEDFQDFDFVSQPQDMLG